MVTPMTQKYFGFGELGNSVMYGLCGVEVIGGFFLVRWLSRVLEERVLLAAGLLVSCVACVWCLVFLADPKGMHVCVCVWVIKYECSVGQMPEQTGTHLRADSHNMLALFDARWCV